MAVKDGCMVKWRSVESKDEATRYVPPQAPAPRKGATATGHRRRLCAEGAVRPAGRRCASGQASLSTCRGKVPNEPPKRPSGKRKRGKRDLPRGRGHMLACGGGVVGWGCGAETGAIS